MMEERYVQRRNCGTLDRSEGVWHVYDGDLCLNRRCLVYEAVTTVMRIVEGKWVPAFLDASLFCMALFGDVKF